MMIVVAASASAVLLSFVAWSMASRNYTVADKTPSFVVGGYAVANANDAEVQNAFTAVVKYFQPATVVLLKASRQIVAGTNYKLTVLVKQLAQQPEAMYDVVVFVDLKGETKTITHVGLKK